MAQNLFMDRMLGLKEIIFIEIIDTVDRVHMLPI
jgi:hypothetical protein